MAPLLDDTAGEGIAALTPASDRLEGQMLVLSVSDGLGASSTGDVGGGVAHELDFSRVLFVLQQSPVGMNVASAAQECLHLQRGGL